MSGRRQLYAQTIFDNKDPLFFYTYAAALWIGGWRGPFLLDRSLVRSRGWGLRYSFARSSSAVRSGCELLRVPARSLAAAGTSSAVDARRARVAPFAPWLWLRGRFAWGGARRRAVMLLKLNLSPVALPRSGDVVLGAIRQALVGCALSRRRRRAVRSRRRW